MALPRRGDPRRPLYLAIRSTRLLGIIFMLIGITLFGVLIAVPASRRTGTPARTMWLIASMGAIYLAPGILYFLFAIFLKRRQAWAVIGGIILAALHAVFALFILVRSAANPVVLIISLLWLIALAQLIFHLSKSFSALSLPTEDSPRGFELLMPIAHVPQPTLPADPQ